MKFAVRKLKPADADALKAAAWYDEQQPGLGDAFFDDMDAAIAALTENPLIYPVRFADVRCIRLRRFTRYGIFYLVVGSEVCVVAVHHGARHPRWLRERRRKLGESY
jgi:plasmid stabilization system protein ParE